MNWIERERKRLRERCIDEAAADWVEVVFEVRVETVDDDKGWPRVVGVYALSGEAGGPDVLASQCDMEDYLIDRAQEALDTKLMEEIDR